MLLRVSKLWVTRYTEISLTPTQAVAQLMLIFLAAELTKSGTAKVVLNEKKILLLRVRLTVQAPKYAIAGAAEKISLN